MTVDIATLAIKVDSQQARLAALELTKLERSGKKVDTATNKLNKSFSRTEKTTQKFKKTVTALGVVFATVLSAVAIKRVADSFVEVASSFEQMEVQLDTLTKGKGTETLEKLNTWALDMPVNTQKAVDAFVQMQAYGLNPTLEKMGTLVDVASIFGEETLPRVSRALGQMQVLGKLSAEELNQLSESGINARKYLKQAIGDGHFKSC